MKYKLEDSINLILFTMFASVLLLVACANCGGCVSTKGNPQKSQNDMDVNKSEVVDSLNQ